MITFTDLLKRAKTEKIAIHTPTETQAKKLLSELDEKGYKWNSREKLTDIICHRDYKENTCYNFKPNNKICYAPLKLYQNEGYTIIEFTDIDFEEN